MTPEYGRSPRGSIAALVLILAAGPGCSAFRPRTEKGEPARASVCDDVQRTARDTLEQRIPRNATLVHRAVVTFGERQFALDGYVEVDEKKGVHLVVLSALGVLADVDVDRAGNHGVGFTAAGFRKSWARRYVARDARVLFMAGGGEDFSCVALEDGRIALQHTHPCTGDVARHIFNETGRKWVGFERVRRGRLRYRVEGVEHGAFPGAPRPMPVRFLIRAERYEADVRMVECNPD